MNILFVSSYYKPAHRYGGPVQSISNLCEGLAKTGAFITVFTTNAHGSERLNVPLQTPTRIDDVDIFYYPLDFKGLTFFYSSSLARSIREKISMFDLIVVEALWGHALIPVAAACKRHLKPYIVSARGQLNPWAFAKKNIKKKIYLDLIGRRLINKASAIYCTDPIEAKAVKIHDFKSPTFIVPNGIHAEQFIHRQENYNFRKQYGIPSDAVVMLFLGRLTQIKRPDIAVDVLGFLRALPYSIHLLVIGPDEENWIPKLRAHAHALGCESNIHFTGLLDKKGVIAALAEVDLMLMPSEIQENFGNSALEAMAAGVPILVSKGVPVGYWAEKAGAGRVVPCTKKAFQNEAIALVSDLSNLKAMGSAGQELVKQKFDVSVVARQMLTQYQAIITSGKPLPSND
jgi:glycosyltransferase involved in cell wall biosynthesis